MFKFPRHLRHRTVTIAVAAIAASITHALDAPALEAQTRERPNVVVILADDQGWGDLSLHGNPNLQTPHIDSIARDGARLNNYYVCPVCAPTRAEFLTGRYHPRSGVRGVSEGGERMNGDAITIAEVLLGNHYRTGAFGKWHNGTQWPYHPNSQGFDEYYGFCSGHWGNYFSPMLDRNNEITTGSGFLPDDLTDHAIEFMSDVVDGSQQPFFMYLPLNTPHSPMQVPDKFYEPFANADLVPDPDPENARREEPPMTRAALAMCENIDWNVGRVLKFLDENNQRDNTIVIYFSDNGPNSFRFNGGLRGRKGSVFEGGVKSPCLIRFPNKIAAGTQVDRVSGAVDLWPTIAELIDLPLDQEAIDQQPLDGVSFAPHLIGASDTVRPPLVTHWNGQVSVREGQFRYHTNGQLYNVAEDPGEHRDVAPQHPDVAARLADAIAKYIAEVDPKTSRGADPRPFTIGYPGATNTQLPARDAETVGQVHRNNRHANCTYMENSTSPDDEIYWNADVAQAGRFEAIMYYAMDAENSGAAIELSWHDASTSAVVDQPNPVKLIGKDDDRVPRIEGYDQRWQPVSLGQIDLTAGAGKLTLKATQIPGKQAPHFRLLVLRRL